MKSKIYLNPCYNNKNIVNLRLSMDIQEFQKTVLEEFKTLRGELKALRGETQEEFKTLKGSIKSLENKTDSIIEVVLKIQNDITDLKKDLSTVETITASNYTDIVKLKTATK